MANKIISSTGYEVEIDNIAKTAGGNTFTGTQTFLSSPIVPTPTDNTQAATKKYVDDISALNIDKKKDTSGDVDLVLTGGLYSYSGALSNLPTGALSIGTLIVNQGVNTTARSQILIDGVDRMWIRYGEASGWNSWKEVANKGYADLKQSKSELAYNVDTSSYIPNTLASGAIIERGSNTNGQYVKFADGTLICLMYTITDGINGSLLAGSIYYYDHPFFPFPATFITPPILSLTMASSGGRLWLSSANVPTTTSFNFTLLGSSSVFITSGVQIVAVGRWK